VHVNRYGPLWHTAHEKAALLSALRLCRGWQPVQTWQSLCWAHIWVTCRRATGYATLQNFSPLSILMSAKVARATLVPRCKDHAAVTRNRVVVAHKISERCFFDSCRRIAKNVGAERA
jgi:hypothetical protein